MSKNPVPKGLRRVKGLHLMLDVGHLVNQMIINLKIGLDNVDIFSTTGALVVITV